MAMSRRYSKSSLRSAVLIGTKRIELKEPSTMEITTVGLDLAKRVFQLHGVDASDRCSFRRNIALPAATPDGIAVPSSGR